MLDNSRCVQYVAYFRLMPSVNEVTQASASKVNYVDAAHYSKRRGQNKVHRRQEPYTS